MVKYAALTGADGVPLTKETVGLGNVDNTADVDKPVSSAVQAALNGLSLGGGYTDEDAFDAISTALVAGSNIDIAVNDLLNTITIAVANLTKSTVGLGNVDNTSDASKPISTLTQTALNGKSATGHSHAAADITSGLLAPARIATGAPTGSKFLRDDQVWATPAGGGATITEVEVDFGTTPTGPTRFTITDQAITATSKVLLTVAGTTPTGGFGDEAEWDPMTVVAVPGSGNMAVTLTPRDGRVVGAFKLHYQIAS